MRLTSNLSLFLFFFILNLSTHQIPAVHFPFSKHDFLRQHILLTGSSPVSFCSLAFTHSKSGGTNTQTIFFCETRDGGKRKKKQSWQSLFHFPCFHSSLREKKTDIIRSVFDSGIFLFCFTVLLWIQKSVLQFILDCTVLSPQLV